MLASVSLIGCGWSGDGDAVTVGQVQEEGRACGGPLGGLWAPGARGPSHAAAVAFRGTGGRRRAASGRLASRPGRWGRSCDTPNSREGAGPDAGSQSGAPAVCEAAEADRGGDGQPTAGRIVPIFQRDRYQARAEAAGNEKRRGGRRAETAA